MFKPNFFTVLTMGFITLLSACNSAEASQPAPVQEAAPVEAAAPEAKAEQPQVEVAPPESKPAEKPAVVVEEVAPAEEPVVAAEETMPAAEAMVNEEAAPAMEKVAVSAEAPPLEEEVMKPEASEPKAGPNEAQLQLLASLKNQGMPPELFNEVWLNSEPLKLADLHGKVVIVEFWTFGCINCKNVVPSLREWHHKYKDEGLVIVGVHTPEFGYERDVENVKQALIDQNIPYSVAIDNDWKTWRAYNNRYWPAKYFIDKAGSLRHIHIGEGRYEQQEEIIRALLAEVMS